MESSAQQDFTVAQVAAQLHIQTSGPPTPFHRQDIDLFAGLVGFVFGAVSGLVVLGFAWLNVNEIAGNPLAGLVAGSGTTGLMIGAITGVALRVLIADNLAGAKNLTRPIP